MRTECLPPGTIPHIAPIYRDFLSDFPKISSFYSALRATPNGEIALSRHEYPQSRRASVATILDRQNRAWGASTKTLENIERLRKGASAVVTGQQVVLFGGPMFAVLKALTAIKEAEKATRAGT